MFPTQLLRFQLEPSRVNAALIIELFKDSSYPKYDWHTHKDFFLYFILMQSGEHIVAGL